MRHAQIRDFIAVAESGSISGAARKLGVSQPAITKSVRELEHALKVSLLQRTNRGVVLTMYGRVLFERARRAHLEIAKAEQEIAQLAGKSADQISFGIGPFAAILLVPDAFASFRQRFAIDDLRIVEGFVHVLVPLVRQGILDFAIGPRLATEADTGVRFRPLFQHEQIVVGRKGHPQAEAKTFSQLLAIQWLSFEPRAQTQLMFTKLGLPPPTIVECESYSAFVKLLSTTDMLGMASTRLLENQPFGNTLRQIFITDPIPALSVGIYTRMDGQMTPSADAMALAITAAGRALASRSVKK
jgi:LysR family transcriptional regulator of abg operon